jgi:hypothetical protein
LLVGQNREIVLGWAVMMLNDHNHIWRRRIPLLVMMRSPCSMSHKKMSPWLVAWRWRLLSGSRLIKVSFIKTHPSPCRYPRICKKEEDYTETNDNDNDEGNLTDFTLGEFESFTPSTRVYKQEDLIMISIRLPMKMTSKKNNIFWFVY